MTLQLTYGCCYRARIGRRDEHFCASVRRVNSLFCEYHHGHQPPHSIRALRDDMASGRFIYPCGPTQNLPALLRV